MPTLHGREQGGLGLERQGRGRGVSPAGARECPGERGVPAFQGPLRALPGHVGVQGRICAGSEVASPANVRVGRRGTLPTRR